MRYKFHITKDYKTGLKKGQVKYVSKSVGDALTLKGLGEFDDPKMKESAPKPKSKRGRKPKSETETKVE